MAGTDPSIRSAALSDVVRSYYPALRLYLVEDWRVPGEMADAVLQGFIVHKVLRDDGVLQKADREKGRFRSFLLTALSNYLARERSRRARLPYPMPTNELPERGVPATQADAFDRRWATQVVRRALEQMHAECVAKSRPDLWALFEERVVAPAFECHPAPSYEELVKRFNIASPREAINLLTTAKRMFNRHLQREVALYEETDEQVDEEIRDLRAILLGTSARPGAGEAGDRV